MLWAFRKVRMLFKATAAFTQSYQYCLCSLACLKKPSELVACFVTSADVSVDQLALHAIKHRDKKILSRSIDHVENNLGI